MKPQFDSPLALTPQEQAIVRAYAMPIISGLRVKFLNHVARLLQRESVLGEGIVSRVCRKAQREYVSAAADEPPTIDDR